MILLPAEKNQIESIVEMSKRAFISDVLVGGSKQDGPPDYDSVEWHEKMAEEGHLFGATVDDVLVGATILFLDEARKCLYIGRIFIDDKYHRKGYGVELMNCVENIFPQVKEIFLDTPVWNVRTNSFYKKLGYAETKREDGFVYYKKSITRACLC